MIKAAINPLQSKLQNIFHRVASNIKRLGVQASLSRMTSATLICALIFITTVGTAQPAVATNFDRKNLRQQDFSGQDLTDNDYTRADLTEANLSHANLELVRLFTTRLTRANLEGANLKGATLDGATLRGANLKDANLEGAYAINIDFEGANIEGADFTDVLLDPKDNERLCEMASGTNSTTGRKTSETLYCP